MTAKIFSGRAAAWKPGVKVGKMTVLTGRAMAAGVNNLVTREDVRALEAEIIDTLLPALRGRQLLPITKVKPAATLYEWDKKAHMSDAEIVGKGGTFPRDKLSLSRSNVPIIKIGKGFNIYREDLLAKPQLQSESAQEAARQVAEMENKLIFLGCTLPAISGLESLAGNSYAASNAWSTAIGTKDPYGDVLEVINLMEIDGFNGPYSLALDPVNYKEARERDIQAGASGKPIIDDILNTLPIAEVIVDDDITHGTALVIQKGKNNASLVVAEDVTIEVFDMDENQVLKGNVFERVSVCAKQANAIGKITGI